MMALLLLSLLVLSLLCLPAVFRRTTSRHGRAPATLRQGKPTVEIHDAAVARRALVDYADAFLNRPAVLPLTGRRRRRSDNLTTAPYGPHWRLLRCNLTGGILHPSRAALLAPLQHKAVEGLVADIAARAAGGEAVVVRDVVHAAVFALVARLCFGDGVGELHVRDLRRVMKEFELDVAVVGSGGSTLARLAHWWRLRQFVASLHRQADVFLPLVAARRRARHDGDSDGVVRPYVDSLIDLRVPVGDDEAGGEDEHHRDLTDDEMVSLVSEFLGGGTESVASCIEWTLAHLVIQPEIQHKLRRDIVVSSGDTSPAPYLRAVILESLRLHPPVPLTMRDVTSPRALEDVLSLPAGGGARVHFILGRIGRDGKAWKDPDEFRPERFLAGGEAEGVGPLPGPKEVRMMPFGAGRRFCPGMGLGLAHAGMFLAALVREFEWSPAEAGGGVDLTEVDGFFKMMRTPLRARATPRRRASP